MQGKQIIRADNDELIRWGLETLIAEAMTDAKPSLLKRDGLTATEIEVLRLVALGKSVKEIALERHSSVHTITTYKKNIFRKINVHTIYDAMRYAYKAGLVELG